MKHSFDQEAEKYDSIFTESKIGRHQRNKVWNYLESIMEGLGDKVNVLELNCGTGEDAIWLAKNDWDVLATDASVRMLEICNKKLVIAGLEKRIKTKQLDLSECAGFKPDRTFDLILSNFGGLNCLDAKQLKVLSENCKSWLSPNGIMVLVIMPKWTALEGFYRIVKGQFKNRKQRRKGHAMVNLNGEKISCFYYNHEEVDEIFDNFITIKTEMISIIPSYFESFIKRHPWLFKYLLNFEKSIKNEPKWINRADHFLIAMKHV